MRFCKARVMKLEIGSRRDGFGKKRRLAVTDKNLYALVVRNPTAVLARSIQMRLKISPAAIQEPSHGCHETRSDTSARILEGGNVQVLRTAKEARKSMRYRISPSPAKTSDL